MESFMLASARTETLRQDGRSFVVVRPNARGAPLVLHVTVDPQGKITGIVFVPQKGDASKAPRCTLAKP
jgi:hypothetical protein